MFLKVKTSQVLIPYMGMYIVVNISKNTLYNYMNKILYRSKHTVSVVFTCKTLSIVNVYKNTKV